MADIGLMFTDPILFSPVQTTDTIPETDICCEACENVDAPPDQALYFCYACDFTFCDSCWEPSCLIERKVQQPQPLSMRRQTLGYQKGTKCIITACG
jgi:hypothetical protein